MYTNLSSTSKDFNLQNRYHHHQPLNSASAIYENGGRLRLPTTTTTNAKKQVITRTIPVIVDNGGQEYVNLGSRKAFRSRAPSPPTSSVIQTATGSSNVMYDNTRSPLTSATSRYGSESPVVYTNVAKGIARSSYRPSPIQETSTVLEDRYTPEADRAATTTYHNMEEIVQRRPEITQEELLDDDETEEQHSASRTSLASSRSRSTGGRVAAAPVYKEAFRQQEVVQRQNQSEQEQTQDEEDDGDLGENANLTNLSSRRQIVTVNENDGEDERRRGRRYQRKVPSPIFIIEKRQRRPADDVEEDDGGETDEVVEIEPLDADRARKNRLFLIFLGSACCCLLFIGFIVAISFVFARRWIVGSSGYDEAQWRYSYYRDDIFGGPITRIA